MKAPSPVGPGGYLSRAYAYPQHFRIADGCPENCGDMLRGAEWMPKLEPNRVCLTPYRPRVGTLTHTDALEARSVLAHRPRGYMRDDPHSDGAERSRSF